MWGYLGTAAVLWGAKLIGDINIKGWFWLIFGDILWIVEGIKIQIASNNPVVIICEILFLFLHIRGWFRWTKKLRSSETDLSR